MKIEFELGICVSNNDPKNLGRIRALPVSILGRFSSLSQVQKYITTTDTNALSNGIYNPWEITVSDKFLQRDPYICEPFLPKTIGLLPNFGQLVKIFNYNTEGVLNEFIGPYTIDQVTLTEEYKNVIDKLQYTTNTQEVLPSKNKTFFSGYKNEQIIIGDNEFIVRLDHINDNKTKKTQYPFLQLSNFNNSFTTTKKTELIPEDVEFGINYIAELSIEYTPKISPNEKNIIGIITLYDASLIKINNKIGLTNKNYLNNATYNQSNYIVRHIIKSNNVNDLRLKINEIITTYESQKKISFFDPSKSQLTQQTENNNVIIQTINRFTGSVNVGGAVNDGIIIPNLNTWVFRLKPNTEIFNYQGQIELPNTPKTDIRYIQSVDYGDLSVLIRDFKRGLKFGDFITKKTRILPTETIKYIPKNEAESVFITYVDKILLLSSIKSPNIISDKFHDGLPSTQFSQAFMNVNKNIKTYGMLRGEPTLNLILKLIDLISNHGHVAGVNPVGSLEGTTKEALNNLKLRIENDIKNVDDTTQNTLTINHSFRIN